MRILTYILGLLLTLQACQQSGTSQQNSVIDQMAEDRLDSTLQSIVDDSVVMGASALIFEQGKEVYFNAYGYADREAGVPMARNTIATIYSMTKPISGVTLMTLYEQGAFSLEDSLAMYAPEFANMQVVTGLDDCRYHPAYCRILSP
jgi:CubicO group peptidase (beta-lactamase class C family)